METKKFCEKHISNEMIAMIISAIFTFFYYGLGFMPSYQPDIYYTINNPDGMVYAMLHLDGRWMNALIYKLLRHSGQSYSVFYTISFLISVLLMVTALSIYGALLLQEIKSLSLKPTLIHVILISLLSCVTIANMFSTEFFLYPDMTIGYVLSILLCVYAAKKYVSYIHSPKCGNLWVVFMCLFLCVYMAETTASIFIILTLPFIFANSITFKEFFKKQLTAGLIYGFAMFSKLVFTAFIVKSSRAQSTSSGLIATAEKSSSSKSGELPHQFILDRITFGMWVYLIILIVLIVFLCITAIKAKKGIEIVKGIYVVSVTVFLGLLPYILRLTSDYKPRIYYPLGTLVGMLITYGIVCSLADLRSSRICALFLIAIVLLASVQWLSFVQMFNDQYITNYEDKFISDMIGESIKEYEDESGIEIKYAVFYSDSIRTKYSRSEGWCITQRGYDAVWSKLQVLNFYLNTEYKNGAVDKELEEYFSQQNWDTFSSEQIVFRDDTIHICSY